MAFRATQGLLLMPDITGYTDFISSVELSHGQHIVSELLQILLRHNELSLKLSEVEGDALLFYRLGEGPTPERIVAQAQRWLGRFHEHLNRLKGDIYCTCGACQNVGNLSLKVIGHYGEIGVHRIGRVQKLVGLDVVLAHRLLKNGVEARDYLLLTDAVFPSPAQEGGSRHGFQRHVETYAVFGMVETRLLDLSEVRLGLPPPDAHGALRELECQFEAAIGIRAPMDEIEQYLIRPERWSEWLDGLESLHYDPTEPLRAGHRHMCTIEGHTIRQTLEHMDRESGEVSFTFRMKPPMGLLKRMYRVVRARQEGDCVRVSQSIHCEGRPLLGWIFYRMALPMLRRNFQRSLEQLKALVEGSATDTTMELSP
jgi:hypothetical protein